MSLCMIQLNGPFWSWILLYLLAKSFEMSSKERKKKVTVPLWNTVWKVFVESTRQHNDHDHQCLTNRWAPCHSFFLPLAGRQGDRPLQRPVQDLRHLWRHPQNGKCWLSPDQDVNVVSPEWQVGYLILLKVFSLKSGCCSVYWLRLSSSLWEEEELAFCNM